jgi:hypothetical protein
MTGITLVVLYVMFELEAREFDCKLKHQNRYFTWTELRDIHAEINLLL